MDEDRFEEHGCEAHLGARIGEDAAVIGEHRRPVERLRRWRRHAPEGEERHDRHDRTEQPEDGEDAAPAEQVPDHARNRRAHEVAGEADREQPADRHLPLMDRHEIADERHRRREHPAGHEPGCDSHRNQEREARRHRANERRQRDDEQTPVHQPGLAEEVSDHAERRLHQRIGERIRGRQQRRGFHVDGQLARDHGNHRIDRAREQRLRKDDKGDDFQDGRNGGARVRDFDLWQRALADNRVRNKPRRILRNRAYILAHRQSTRLSGCDPRAQHDIVAGKLR